MNTLSTPQVWSLSSGSKANCTLVSSGQTNILIDFGVSCRTATTMLRSIGKELSDIDAVFITHEHTDHVAGLETFFKKFDIPVHMTEPSLMAYARGKGFAFRDRPIPHETAFSAVVGEMVVTSLPVRHDSAACVAYKISGGGLSLGICTDVGCPTDELLDFFSDCRDVITECNHDVIMLKLGLYPEELKYRILSDWGHTSNDDCAAFTVKLVERGVQNIMLAHVSPENNTPELALYTVQQALDRASLSPASLLCAPRAELMRFV